MPDRHVALARRYSVPLAAVVIAVVLRSLLNPILYERLPFATIFLAILVSAWHGGFGPALFATILGGLAGMVYLFPPYGSLWITHWPDRWALVLYALVGVGIASLGGMMSVLWRRTVLAAEELSTTLASIGDAVIATDAQGRVRALNRVAETLTGWTEREAIGEPLERVFKIVNQTTRRTVENPVDQVLRTGKIVGLANHTVLIARDGTETGIDDSAAPICAVGGEVTGVVLVFRDVTLRRRAEDARRRLAAIVESSVDAIVGKDLDGTITEWNRAAESLYGYAAEEILGKHFNVLVPEERSDEVSVSLENLRTGRHVPCFETVRKRKDGGLIEVSVSYSPIHNGDGAPVGAAVITRDISERKRAEEQLRNEQARFAAVIDHSPACIFAKDWDGKYVFANLAFAELVGCRADEIPGRSDVELFGGELAARFAEEDASVLQRRESFIVEDAIEMNGETRRFLTVKFPLEDAEGNAYAACGIATDISQLKQTQAALSANEERLRLALDAGNMGVWDWNLRTNEIDWSDRLAAIFGLGPGAFDRTPEGVQRFIHPEDRNLVEEAIHRALETQTAFEVEFRNLRPDGSVYWMLNKGRVFSDGDGPARMVGISVDVTERRFSEETAHFLADASAELASLVDYESTLQKVAQLCVPFFADWCAVDMVEGESTLRRVAVAHVDPEKVKLAHEIHSRFPPDPNAPRGVWNIIRSGKAEIVPEISDEVLVATFSDPERLKAYREIGMRSYIGVPIEARGKVFGAIIFIITETGHRYTAADLAVAEDLAHRAAVAIENTRLYQQVREADRRKDEFLAMLAHELRNPLAPIRTGLELLSLTSNGGSQTIELMQNQVGHLVRLVDDLLDVSRIVRGRVDLRLETVSLQKVVENTLSAIRPMTESRDQDLIVDVPEETIWLHADHVRLAQVMENLLNNASKYTNGGGRIELSVKRDSDRVEIIVEDNGIGIEAELLPHVFDLFTQASRSLDRAQGGLGIGLTLVRNLVELHGGSVSAYSRGAGHGSRFTVSLPVAGSRAEKSSHRAADSAAGSGRRVLVVDDNVSAAQMLALLLSRMGGHEAKVAHDGSDALSMMEEFRPEVVLLDIGLPGMDGFEVGRRIRERREFDQVLLVALTGYGQDEDRRRSEEAGFDVHLVKPVASESLGELFCHPKLQVDG